MPIERGIYYEWHGPEDGQVLILSSGLGGSGGYWAPNLPALSADHRVLVYDHRGTGRSGPLPAGPTSIEAMAEDVLALMIELDIHRPNFVGHAVGGLIGLQLDLLHAVLDRLVIVNAWARLDAYTARCFDVRLELLRKSGPEAYVRAQPIFLYPPSWISKHGDLLDADARHQLAHFPPIETVERRIAAAREFERWYDVTCPVRVIASEDDMLVPLHTSKALMEELPAAGFRTMKWGGHACNVTDPETFNKLVLDFLGS